jgi:hypothetical protein
MFDFIVAYDENVPNLGVTKNDLLFYLRGINVSEVNLGGTQTGNISGDIVIDSRGQSNLFNIGSLKIDHSSVKKDIGDGNYIDTGATATANSKDAKSWWGLVKGQLSQRTSEAVGDVGGALMSNSLNLVLNPVQNLVNSLIHKGSPGSTGFVDLKMSTSVNMSGTITDQQPVQVTNLYVPGSVQDENGIAYVEDADFSLGVFNLSTTPIVNYAQVYARVNSQGLYRYCQFFSLDRNSFDIVINPEIQDDIVIVNRNAELYFYEEYSGPTKLSRVSLFHPYQTDVVGNNLVNDSPGNRWFKLVEGFDLSNNSAGNYGISRLVYYESARQAERLEADGRIVVKVTLQFRDRRTGSLVTHIQTYLPELVGNNQWWPIISY